MIVHATAEFIKYITGPFPKDEHECRHDPEDTALICGSDKTKCDWILACEVDSANGDLKRENKINCEKCIKIMKEKGL